MPAFICRTCGTQFSPSPQPPERCPVCEDERQYVPATGQAWTTLAELNAAQRTVFRYDGSYLGIGTTPDFAIGQRALLVRTPAGNVLWDCIAPLDQAAVDIVTALGGLAAIAISHPHYYTTMVDWSAAFGDAPIHLHAADRQWVMRPDPRIAFWDDERREIAAGLTLIRCGGHFEGATVLYDAEKRALLSGDVLQVVPDRAHLGFMRSYPNYIPLGAAAVRRIAASLDGFEIDSVHGAFWGRVIPSAGRAAIDRSVRRHITWVSRD